MHNSPSFLSRRLAAAGPVPFSLYCMVAAFGTYFCMYAFRKPFSAATFEDDVLFGIGLKTVLVAAQVSGYTLSKFIGIKVVSEMPARYRAVTILGLIAVAEAALLMFAISPPAWGFVWLFINGLPLGMVFGLVLGFLEGRKVTESLSAALCASFILASGVVKSTGKTLLDVYGVGEFWMPFATGLIFVLPLLLFVWMLAQIPPPSAEDEHLRTKRTPMSGVQRRAFFRRHALGLCGLLAIYVLLTIVRSLRDDFAVEIWQGMGVSDEPSVFAWSETWVMLGVVAINALAIFERNNRRAFLLSIGLIGGGFLLVLGTLLGHWNDALSPMMFMVLLGLGMYIPYVAFHTTVFERLIASFREPGNIGYLMYLADALGYLGYVGMLIFRNTATGGINFLELLVWVSLGVAVVSTVIVTLLSLHYFRTLPRPGAALPNAAVKAES